MPLAVREQHPYSKADTKNNAEAAFGTFRALVVDDSQQVRELLSLYLRKSQSFVVTGASSRIEVANLYRHNPHVFDFVFVDFRTGGDSGVAILEDIFQFRPDSLALMITASAGAAQAEMEAARLQIPILQKPFKLKELEAAVECLTKMYRLRMQSRS